MEPTKERLKVKGLFWTGKLPVPPRIIVNAASLIAWIRGNARDSEAMKRQVFSGYDATFSDHVLEYDRRGEAHYSRIAERLIGELDCEGKRVADVGCGTGILTKVILEKKPSRMACIDGSSLMLEECRAKCNFGSFSDTEITFHETDAENLPFPDQSFDIVSSSMVLGMIPDQSAALREMTRILRPGGVIGIATHGPSHYAEAIEAGLRAMTKRHFLSHRFEFWPRREEEMARLFCEARLEKVAVGRITWTEEFESGRELFDFYAATSSLWWYHRLPSKKRKLETEKTRASFQRGRVTSITSDVVFSFGTKKDKAD